MKDLLKTLVAFQTVADQPATMLQALDFIDNYLSQRGMFTQRITENGCPSLIAKTHADVVAPSVVLGAHLDVVPAPSEMFQLRESEGKLYGRGTLDMKFAIAAYMQLVDDLKGQLTKYNFGLMITTDEELGGMNGAGKLAAAGFLPKVLVLPDGGDNWQIQTFSKGFLYLSIDTVGRTAHGSKPWLGQNAILQLVDVINDIQKLFPDPSTETNTLNIGQIQGGEAPNQVPATASAILDARFMSESEKSRISTAIQGICAQHGANLNILIDGPTCDIDLTNPLVAPFVHIIREVTGISVTGSRTTGTNDVRFFAAHGVPGISLYPTGGGHHGPDEWIDEKAFYQFKDVIARYVDQIAQVQSVALAQEVLTATQ